MKRIYYLLLFFLMPFAIAAQDTENEVEAKLELYSISGAYHVVEAANEYSGVVNDTKVKVMLTVTPRKVAPPSPEDLTKEEYAGADIYRPTKEKPEGELVKSLEKNVFTFDDEFVPEEGVNQSVTYRVVFFFQTYTRPNKEVDDWTPEGSKWSDPDKTKETDNFNVFSIPTFDQFEGFTKENLNTFVDGLSRSYNAKYTDGTGNPQGWKVKWSFTGKPESEDNSYILNPANMAAGDYVLKVSVINYAPGYESAENNENYIWFKKEDEKNVKIYNNPNTAAPEYKEEGVVSQYTYVGRGDVKYWVKFPDAGEYGDWKYFWDENPVPGSNEYPPFSPGFGIQTTKLKLQCYNPDDSNEEWGAPKELTFTLNVCENPNEVNLKSDCSEGFKIVTCKRKEPENGVVYQVVDAATGSKIDDPKYGKWKYQWFLNGNKLDYTDYEATIYPTDLSVGTYKISVSLSCVNPGNDTDEWRTVEPFKVGNYYVYPEPECTQNNIHLDKNDHTDKYAMFLGDVLEKNSENLPLYTTDGGFSEDLFDVTEEGLSGGWESVLELEGQSGLSYTKWEPSAAGNYTLHLTVRNFVKQNDVEILELYKDVYTYNVEVCERPEYDPNQVIIQINGKNIAGKGNETSIDIKKDDIISFNVTKEGGGDYWTYEWTVAPQQGEGTQNVNPFEWKGVNDSQEESMTFKVVGGIKNDPPGIIDGCQYPGGTFERNVVVWNNFALNKTKKVIPLVYDEVSEEYTMETCEGLNDGKEIIQMLCDGGNGDFWTLSWQPLNGAPAPVKMRDPSNKKSYSAEFKDLKPQTDGPTTYHYKVIADYINGEYTQNATLNVAIVAWPKPEIKSVTAKLIDKPETETSGVEYEVKDVSDGGKQIDASCYDGDEIQLSYTVAGGYNGNNSWTYTYDGNAPASIDYPSGSKTITGNYSGSAESKHDPHHLTIYHKYDGKYYTSNEDWFSSNIAINTYIYATPTLTPNLKDSTSVAKWGGNNPVDVYAGGYNRNNVIMEFIPEKGVNGGWTYQWYLDDNPQGDNKKNTWTYVPSMSTSENYQDKTIKVDVINCLPDGNKGLVKHFKYPIRVWRKAKFPEKFDLEDVNQNRDMTNGYLSIRSGNTIDGSVSPIQYGYRNNYVYQWTGVDDEVDHVPTKTSWTTPVKVSSDSPTKTTEKHTYSLWMYNTGPYGRIWDGARVQQTVEVYNKPATPTSIIQKGNGSSRTMIATASVSDQDLQGRDYYLVFGYTDANGQDHDFSSQQQKVPGQVRWSSQFSNQQEMSSAYVYAVWKYAAAEITSGKCMLSGTNEAYDTSSYGGRTRVVLGGDDYDAIDDVQETNSFMDTAKGVYTLEGTRVGTTLSGLKAGMYIVVYANGVTKKIIVK